MATFQFAITDEGLALLAQIIGGQTLTLTRAVVGEGALPEGTDLHELTELVDDITAGLPAAAQPVISGIAYTAAPAAVVRVTLANIDLETAYTLREVGLYADDLDSGEILFLVGNAGDTADTIPTEGTPTTLQLDINIVASNASSITAALVAVDTVPAGAVMLWPYNLATSPVPVGWALCDGSNGTPDLRGKFPFGADGSHAALTTGGAASVTLTTDNLPDITGGGYVGPLGATAGGIEDGQDQPNRTVVEGGGQAVATMPPYFALHFIVKL